MYLYELEIYALLAWIGQIEREGLEVYHFHTDQVEALFALTDSPGEIVW